MIMIMIKYMKIRQHTCIRGHNVYEVFSSPAFWMPLPVYKSPGFKDAALGPLTGIFHIHHLDAENQSADQRPRSHSVPQDEPQDGGAGVYCR